MERKRYWFPVRPAQYGWGWGLPVVWQGWVVLAAFLALLIGGLSVLVPYGQLVSIAFSLAGAALLLAIVWWKGEPQKNRHRQAQPAKES